MSNITVHKLNESYSLIDSDDITIKKMFEYLKVERPGAYFEPAVKAGFKSPYEYFGSIQNKKLLVLNGHMELLKSFGVDSEQLVSEYSQQEIDNFLNNIKVDLPFEPYDFQITAFKESLLNVKQINKMSTGSGKSLTISLIAEFFRQNNKKGLLLVPNINLLIQFKNDIKDYNLIDLYNNTHVIGGGQTERHFNKSLTISTWQSMMSFKGNLDELDYVITDECLHPETYITTDNGDVQIKDVKPGMNVLTLNEKTGLKEYKPVKKVHKNLAVSRKEKMYKLTLENGNTIKITGNHKVNTSNGWKRVDELNINDEIISI